jgi:ABC-type glutathione transport system ATPase component
VRVEQHAPARAAPGGSPRRQRSKEPTAARRVDACPIDLHIAATILLVVTNASVPATIPRSEWPAVRCHRLVKRYADVVAVGGLDLEVRRGECLACSAQRRGQTTTIEILEGLTTPDEGEVEVLGGVGARNDRSLRGASGSSCRRRNHRSFPSKRPRAVPPFYPRRSVDDGACRA